MTQLTEAKAGRITPEAKQVAQKEKIPVEKIRRGIAAGRIVLLKNEKHDVAPVGIGQGLRVKVNANIGTSRDYCNLEEEKEKARVSVEAGADTVMDLSTGGDLAKIRKEIMKAAKVPIGTVPIYEAAAKAAKSGKGIVGMCEDDFFKAVEGQLRQGVDFLTVHCGISKEIAMKIGKKKRLTGVVSRGGAFTVAWILHNGKDNPLHQNFDYLLELARDYDATLSLGDGLRPGALADAGDYFQLAELKELGRLVQRSRKAGVMAMVEGPGHVPINQIPAQMKLEKKLCYGAPFYVLGPLVCDVGAGYDHITAAIGGAIAAMNGADFLCYVTPSEHLALPTVDEVRQGVVATKIAAHAVDLTRFKDEWNRDVEMSRARAALDWKKMYSLALDGKTAQAIRKKRCPGDEKVCSMCGDLCAIKVLKDALGEKGKKKGVC